MPVLDLEKTEENKLALLIENRWKEAEELSKIVRDSYEKNFPQWTNNPDWVGRTPPKKSKTRVNRSFLAMESVITNLSARPSKPNVLPAQDTNDSKTAAENLQDFFLEKHRDLNIKAKMRIGLRWLFLAKMICLKAEWNDDMSDFDFVTIDPRNVRFKKGANNHNETDIGIEYIEKPASEALLIFKEDKQREKIRKYVGASDDEQAFIDNRTVKYYEAWIGNRRIRKLEASKEILSNDPNPYWDFDGLLVRKTELERISSATGEDRRTALEAIRKLQSRRTAKDNYDQYFLNYFDRPMHPYIFGTVLSLGKQSAGETSLMEQVGPLQFDIDKRKRQIADNASQANGKWKVDTRFLPNITKAQVETMKSDPEGAIFGDGVKDGITIETGRDLPSMVFDDLKHSINELDSIFGSDANFRGEQSRTETAQGRAILREQSFQRLDELTDLLDNVYLHIYKWQLQFIKVKYSDERLMKRLGKEKALETIGILRDDIEDGIELRVIPGQVLPDDRFYRSERAFDAAKANLITPLSYFEAAGFDNPMDEAKRLEMYKINPFSILDMTDEDIQSLQRAQQLLAPPAPPEPAGADPQAQQLAQLRAELEQLTQSPEFQDQPPEEKRRIIGEFKQRMQALTPTA